MCMSFLQRNCVRAVNLGCFLGLNAEYQRQGRCGGVDSDDLRESLHHSKTPFVYTCSPVLCGVPDIYMTLFRVRRNITSYRMDYSKLVFCDGTFSLSKNSLYHS